MFNGGVNREDRGGECKDGSSTKLYKHKNDSLRACVFNKFSFFNQCVFKVLPCPHVGNTIMFGDYTLIL